MKVGQWNSNSQGRVPVTEFKEKINSVSEVNIGGRKERDPSVMGGNFYGLCNPFGFGSGYINFVALILIRCFAHIKSFNTMGFPCFLLRRPFLDHKFCARRGKRIFIESKCTI